MIGFLFRALVKIEAKRIGKRLRQLRTIHKGNCTETREGELIHLNRERRTELRACRPAGQIDTEN